VLDYLARVIYKVRWIERRSGSGLEARGQGEPGRAYLLCSLAADLHVTQTVDVTKGVHAMLPKSIFR